MYLTLLLSIQNKCTLLYLPEPYPASQQVQVGAKTKGTNSNESYNCDFDIL